MTTGEISGNIDVAQLVLYGFWLFFAGLIWYLRQEDKREGYPLEHDDGSPHTLVDGFPGRPDPKTFVLQHGGTVIAPVEWKPGHREVPNARSVGGFPGAPLEPVGNGMLDGVGPGSWAHRADVVELTYEGVPKIVPLRADADYSINPGDPDPRGKSVYGADDVLAGTVIDAWVDRSERLFRYFEVQLLGRSVLIPANFSRVNRNGSIKVHSILAKHFIDVPGLKNPEQITMLEEEKIMAYYGAGTLYATPDRMGPLL